MRARLAILLLTSLAAPTLAGCDIALVLILSPFFPGQEIPPPDDLTCPLEIAAPAELPPLPTTFAPEAPALDATCDVGVRAIHRLNRAELDNTLRDLTGLDLDLAATSLPPDDFAGGFDNNAEVLTVSPLLAEKLEVMMSDVVRQAMQRPGEISEIRSFEAEEASGDSFMDAAAGVRVMGRGGNLDRMAILPNAGGTYAVRMRAFAENPPADGIEVELLVDGRAALRAPVTGTAANPQLFEARLSLDKGPVHRLGARVPPGGGGGQVRVDFFEVEGPLVVTDIGPDPDARKRIVTCDLSTGMDCAEQVVTGFAQRAWRRPLDVDERQRLRGLMLELERGGDTLEDALRGALTAVLLAPHFLYKVELDPDLADPTPHLLDDHALAVRLAYFLWSSMPDDRLLSLAAQGGLQDPAVLETEVRRMVDDPRSQAFVENFAGQWLFTRAVSTAAPDPVRFPEFDETLRSAMQCETQLTFDRLLRDDTADLRELLTAQDTFVNARLARHYGIEPPTTDTLGHGWGLVSTAGTGRSGVLTNASLLTVTSQPTRTSPTRRGKWVLENMLCSPPDAPPPEVEGLPEPAPGTESESLRERLEQHRNNPACMGCHSVIDPIGLGLEHFDGIGRWRASDAGFRIDDSALYMDAVPFQGAQQLGALLADDPLLPFCVAEKTMTYAVGRGFTDNPCVVADVTRKFEDGGYNLKDLIVEVALSPAFRMRRAAAPGE